MRVLFNFLDKYGVETYNAFIRWSNDPTTSNLEFLARKLGVTPSRASQWLNHFCNKVYEPKKDIVEALEIWIDIKRRNLNEAEETIPHHATVLKLVNGSNHRA